MKLTKDKVLAVRENADRLLAKMETEEKDEVKKIALSYSRFNGLLESLVRRVENNEKNQTIVKNIEAVRDEMKKEVAALSGQQQQTIQSLMSSLNSLKQAFSNKKEYDGNNIVQALKSLKLETPAVQQQDRTEDIITAIKSLKVEVPPFEFPESISVNNFPPQKVPQPVTHFSINALRGFVHTTAATVDTDPTPLPEYGVLQNRRAIIIFNNDPTATLYIGGSTVTTANGMPVLAQSYSPILDAGVSMIVYGIVESGAINVRVLEASDESSGR